MRREAALGVLIVLVAVAGCGRRNAPDERLRPVPLPDMSRSDRSVQEQARARHAAVATMLARRADDHELGAAFGELGMLFHAAEYLDVAEPAYVNAETLVPDDPRWPYYLAHVHRASGDLDRSIASFEHTLRLQPSDAPALVWLGRTYADLGRADDAERIFERARQADPRSVAVMAGLAQAALARRDYARAASLFEQALAINPRVTSLHAPLATAYRGLGDAAKADAQLARWSNTEIPLPDPLIDRVKTAIESGVSYETRGVRAFEEGRAAEAAELFRRGLAITPHDTPLGRSLRQKLALALYIAGDAPGAIAQYQEAIRLAPAAGRDEPAAQAHYGLGIIRAAAGRGDDAIDHLTRALAYDPDYAQARLALGDALRRAGRFEEALTHYRELESTTAHAAEARFGYAMALVRLGRWVDARQSLDEAVQLHPDRPELAHALARVLAAAPDTRARDGERAFAIVQTLLEGSKRIEFGETLAMAYAELGEFDAAAGIQRGIIAAAERARLHDASRRMAENLRLYEQRRPCRMPWADDDPVHRPGPPVSNGLAEISDAP